MIYNLRCRLGAWCLKWHVTAQLEHYDEEQKLAARSGSLHALRAQRLSYICIGLKYTTRGPWADARRYAHGDWPATRPLWRRWFG